MIYKNPYALSIAFAADNNAKDLILSQVKQISPFTYLDGMLRNLSGIDRNVFTTCKYSITKTFNCSYKVGTSEIRVTKTNEGKAYYEYTVTAKENGSIYMHLLSEYANPVLTYYVNGVKTSTFFDTNTRRIHNIGYFEKGEDVTVRFEFDAAATQYHSDVPTFVQVNQEKFENAINALQKGNLVVTDYSDTRIEGTIKADKDQFVFTTIPYDKYWNVYVDGERVETYATMDTLLSFDITEGEHEIKMVYVSLPFYCGLGVTLA